MSHKLIFAIPKKAIKNPSISASCNSIGISDVNADCFANRCISRLFQLKPQLCKEAESDPELSNYLWNGSDLHLPHNDGMERTNKASLEYINSTFGGMCINKMREQHRAKCELQSRFDGLVIIALTEAIFFLVLKAKF